MATSYLDAINRLYEIERGRAATNGAAAYTAGAATVAPVSAGAQSVENTKKNKLGPIGGIGYIGEKFGAGVMQSIEGIWDFVAGGIADLDWVGQHKWAEKQVANDWFGDWYDTAGSWYNAGGGWQLAGDVSQGIGTSAVSIASAFIPYVGPAVAIATAAASGGGSGVREAYKESGKLTDDEWKYGTMVGATEGVLEAATNAIGAGSGALIKTFSKTASKNLAKGVTKVATKTVYESGKKALAKSFAGEFFEEGMATFLSPYYARMTYNPNAENATGQEIAYSALVGGLAGVVMGGADVGIKTLDARNAGAKIYEKGTESSALNAADFILEEESRDPLGSAYTVELSKLRRQLDEHLSATNGAYDNKAKTLLGKINVVSTVAASERALNASAVHIALNADQVAQALNDLNYTDGNGNKITYTADQLREGIEFKDGKPTKKSINRALKNNVVLRELVTRDAAGHLLMDTDVFAESAMQGRFALNEQELGDFIYKASDAKKRELGKALGIEDWNAVDVNQVNDRISEFMDNGGDMWYARRADQIAYFESRRGSRKTRLANASDYSRKRDGIGHYEIDGNEIGIEKDGDTYTLYDYDNKTISKDLTENELRSALAEYDSKRENAKGSAENVEQASEQSDAAKNPESKPSTLSAMDAYAREKVTGFSRLNPANKATVRRILRQGRALGVKESVLLDFANVAARAKIDVVFDKEATKVAWKNKDGDIVESYGDAFYDPHGVRIVANPEAQSSDRVLIHELDHSLRKDVKDGKVTTKTFKKAIEAVPKEEAQKIAKRYTGKDVSDAANATSESNKNVAIEAGKITLARVKAMNPARTNTEDVASVLLAPDVIDAVIEAKNVDNELNAAEKEKYADELNAYYAQTVLGEKDVIKYLVAEKPALKEKILSFFKKASNDYSGAPNLQRQAMKYYKQYRKWFNEFAENRQGAQMGSAVVKTDAKDLAYSFSSIAHTPSSKNIAWRNVDYGDAETKANITSDTHKKMVEDGLIVKIPDETASKVKKSYPDLQGMSKKERLPILKDSIKQLKNNLRAFLVQLKGKSFEFEVEGDVLEAKLYNSGIDEVLEKITQDKAEMLYTTEEIFRNSRYLYSTPDYSGDANIYRWNYFYTPVQIGDNIVGVRIAIRDMAKQGDSQIYNWGIKKDTSLGGVRDDHTNRKSNDASSDASSKDSISQPMDSVNDGDKKTSKIAKDSLGNELTEAQTEYFKDSKERDKDGNLRVMYQGAAEDFSVFDRKKSKPSNLYGRGFYFTDSVTNANLYGSARAFYLNITNPLSTDKRTITRIQMRKFLNAVAKNEDYGIENYGTRDVGEVLASVYSGKSDFAMIQDVNATCIGDLVAAVELFNEVNGTSYDGFILDTESVTFQSAQAKLTLNKTPTLDPNISYSLPDDLDPNTPLLDENGKPIPYESFVDRGVPYAKMPEINETVGKMRQHIANAEHYKVFSKRRILKDIRQMSVGDLLKEDTRKKIADSVWQSFNSFKHAWEAESYIKDMSRYILSAAMREGKTARAIPEEAQRRFDSMYPYIRRLTFTERELEDIRAARGDDGYKSLLGRWGYKETKADASGKHKKTHSTPMDVFVTDIAREVEDFKSLEDMNPVDAFLALDDAYTEAKKDLAEKWQPALEDATDADLEAILNYIEIDLRTAYQDLGDKSAFMRDLEPRLQAAKERADRWKAEYDKTDRYARYSRIVEDKARQIRDLKRHKFHNATQAVNDTLDQSIGSLSNAIHRGIISVSKARKACAELALLYKSDDFRKNILLYEGENEPGLYNGAVETYLQILANGDHKALQHLNLFDETEEEYRQSVNVSKGFSAHELVLLDKVMSYFINFYKSYGKVFHRGARVDLSALAVEMVNIQQENASLRENVMLRTVAGKWYSQTHLDPMSLMRMADGYVENGFNTTMMEDLREGKIKAMFEEMRIMKQYDEFMKKNEKYFRKASENSVNVRGRYITKIKLIDLYLSTFRKQAWEGLAINGYQYTDTEGNTVRVDGELDAHRVYEEQEFEDAVLRLRGEIEQHLSATDREYIELVEHIYNVESKRLKYNRDVERFGFSNVENEYYYPIRRANRAVNVDKADIKEELDRVSNASFNKEIVKHARQELAIESVDSRLRRHVTAVCQYAHMSAVVEAFNQIFNFDISGNPDRPVSVKTEMMKSGNRQLEDYWKKLIGDAQGVNTKLEGDDVLSWLRSGYAIATLSANPKVWLTQLSSFASASGILSYSSIIKGFGVAKKEDIQNIGLYCPLAELRRYENTAALAQGVLDKRGVQKGKGSRAVGSMRKLGELGMKPIGAVDEFVINRLFGACMIEVQKNGGPNVGDEANKIAAGKLLTKLILETQQNAMATERSAAMRSGNEVLRTSTMFSADAMKNVGRFFDAAGEVRVLKARIKNAADPDVKAQYKARLKLAKRKLRKSVAALLLNAAYMAGIAVLFKHIFNKWDKEWNEDEERWVTYLRSIGIDFIGNMVGGLPLLRDAYSKLVEGYDIDNYSYSAINDVLDSASSIWKLFNKDTTSEDITSALKKLVYSTSSFTGLPARNVYNLVFGLTKRFSEATAYKIDEIFYKHNYKSDLGKYIEQGDTKMADFMLGLLYDTETTELADSTMKSLRSLAELGYTVTPREVADTITVDGEEYAIAPEEQSLIEEQYFSRLSALDRLTSSASYGKLSDEQRADAVKAVHDMTYKKAVSDVMGTEASKSVLIASCVGVENLAVLNSLVKGYEDDVSKTGDKVSGSKRKKIIAAINSMPLTLDQKILLVYAKGYTPKDGEIPGVSAESAKKRLLRSVLNAKDLTKSQKESLAKACGFTVKNGKISL